MSKIYYMKQPVKLGDKVTVNGMTLELTEQIVNDNPDLFEVQEEIMPKYVECIEDTGGVNGAARGEILKSWHDPDKSYPYRFARKNDENGFKNAAVFYKYFKPSTKEAWLLQEAKKRYPKGTKFRSVGALKEINESFGIGVMHPNYKVIGNKGGKGCFYKEGQWAEIVKPLFVTEDGVEIFEGDEYWYINDAWNIDKMCIAREGHQSKHTKARFSTEKAAEEYINKHKEKTLEDYENELLSKKDIVWPSSNSITIADIYRWLRKNNPKLYWTTVLELIADDLNRSEYDSKRSTNYGISHIGGCSDHYGPECHTKSYRNGMVTFLNKEIAEKAIKIMGDKLDIIYKH